tara:strand:+ start:329 stop:511 length:183 start_codon:yes stop_codon:yes gene_type:complete
MTREEEIEVCIMTLKHRIPITANALPEYGRENKTIKSDCEYLIKELQDLIGYIDELEELN